jgi:hypothetical protein
MPTKTPTKKPADIPMPPEWIEGTVIEQLPAEPPDEPAVVGELLALTEPIGDVLTVDLVKSPAPTSNSVIVGLGALAAMSDEEYEQKKAIMAKGIARVKDIQQSLMDDKEDYGRVPGIAKPFLKLPGAEKLVNFYGYAIRQEVDRIVRTPADSNDVPPLSYHVRSYVHLGSLDGPVIAMGYGEANSYEEKYKYRFEKPLCEKCGHEMKRGKPGGNMAGMWFCPGFEGGCWAKVPIESMPPMGKVENTEPYGLAETLIQMAAKRSFVAATRRATGTSGLFTQDEDSPSVQQQSSDSGEGQSGDSVTVEPESIGIKVEVGAKSEAATQVQHDRLMKVAKEKGLNGAKIADLLLRLFEMEVEPTGQAAGAAVQTLNGKQMGQLIMAVETGTLPDEPDPVALATAPNQ